MWLVNEKENSFFENEFSKVSCTYVADGHHRTAAAYNVGKMRRDKAIQDKKLVTGTEDFNFFMSILYPAKQLKIMDYNRVLKTLNGLSTNEFLDKLSVNGYLIQSGLTLETAKPK